MSDGVGAAERARLGGQGLRRIVYDAREIASRVRAMGREISAFYGGTDDLLVLGLLKGSFIFVADLVRQIELPLQVDFLMAASYGNATVSSGRVRLLYEPETRIEGRALLVVEDIVDSGTTLARVLPMLEERGARSVEVCALLHKRVTVLEREARWVGFDAPAEFLVGYGLDYGENFRHLPYIGSLREHD